MQNVLCFDALGISFGGYGKLVEIYQLLLFKSFYTLYEIENPI